MKYSEEQKFMRVGSNIVERDALHIAERINEYDSNLRVQYLEQAASVGEPPFRVVEKCRDGEDRIAFFAWVLDERVLERVYAADTAIMDVEAAIANKNIKARADQKRRYQEAQEEAHDIAHHILKSPKSRYTLKQDDRLLTFE